MKISNLPPDCANLLQLHEKRIENAAQYFLQAEEWTDEGDFLEICLLRSHQQLLKLFPTNSATPGKMVNASEIIRDKRARELWNSMLSTTCSRASLMHWNDVKMMLDWPVEQHDLLRFILDFPRDGVITAFKFHNFVSLFGPWNTLRKNFEQYVVGGGFSGFISRANAERILRVLPDKTVLMRASRTHASLMALSYRPSQAVPVMHITNNSNFWILPEFAGMLTAISSRKGRVPHSRHVYAP